MKYIMIYILSILLIYCDNKSSEVSINKLIDALTIVESNDRDIIGDNGRAHGILQIHQIYIDDVNRVYNTSYTIKHARDRKLARVIVAKYLRYWGKRYCTLTGNKISYEVLARIHNGGPKGYTKKSTIKYWLKVNKQLKR
jgi:hypothetical protein